MSTNLKRSSQRGRGRRLRLESLENRRLLSSSPVGDPAASGVTERAAQLALMCDSGGNLYKYTFAGAATKLTITSWPGSPQSAIPQIQDVAFDGSGLSGFYGIHSLGRLYQITLASVSGEIKNASITEISRTLPSGLNSLGFSGGSLWAANNTSLFQITPAGAVSNTWALPSAPAGDIEFFQGAGFVSMYNGKLLRFDPANPAAMTEVDVHSTVRMGGLAYGHYGTVMATLGFSGRNVYKLNVANPSYWTWDNVGTVVPSVIGGAAMPAGFSFFLEPEIVVTGRGREIANGDTTPSLLDGTQFGIVQGGGAAPAHTFTVSNTGTAVLTTASLTVPEGFVVTEPLAAEIPPGASDDFTIQLTTAAPGRFAGDVRFENNDGDGGDGVENPFHFRVMGYVLPAPQPEIAVFGSGNFGTVRQDARGPARTFVVVNLGRAPLTTGPVTVPEGFVVTEPLDAVIPPFRVDSFTVCMATTPPGTFGGDLVLVNNDADENPCRIGLRGTVLPSARPAVPSRAAILAGIAQAAASAASTGESGAGWLSAYLDAVYAALS